MFLEHLSLLRAMEAIKTILPEIPSSLRRQWITDVAHQREVCLMPKAK